MISRIPSGQPSARLEQVERQLARHVEAPWRHPIGSTQRAVVEALANLLVGRERVVLDAGCGTGASTRALALADPDAFVVGIDKSTDRLTRTPPLPSNAAVVRGDLVDCWRGCHEAGIRFVRTYLLYPNPWPKPSQSSRRWHGHPVFPTLLACTRAIELRTNWPVYAEEFAHALGLVIGTPVAVERFVPSEPISPFESKYLASGHPLWRVASQLVR